MTNILRDIEECTKDSAVLSQRQEELNDIYVNNINHITSNNHNHIEDANANPTTDETFSSSPSHSDTIPLHPIPRSDSSDNDYVTLDNSITNRILNRQKEQQMNKLAPWTQNRINVRPLNQQHLNKNWNTILSEAEKVSAANMVNGDYTEMLSYMDDHSGISAMSDVDTCSQTSFSQQSTIASSGYHSTTPYSAGYDTSKSDAQYALSFSNPVFHKDNAHPPGSPNGTESTNKDSPRSVSNSSNSSQQDMRRSYSHDLLSSPMASPRSVDLGYSFSSNESLLSLNDCRQSPRHHRTENKQRHCLRNVSISGTRLHDAPETSRPPLYTTSSVEYAPNR